MLLGEKEVFVLWETKPGRASCISNLPLWPRSKGRRGEFRLWERFRGGRKQKCPTALRAAGLGVKVQPQPPPALAE